MTGVRCVCGKKLAEAVEGRVVIRCRGCGRMVLLTGSSAVEVLDRIGSGALG